MTYLEDEIFIIDPDRPGSLSRSVILA